MFAYPIQVTFYDQSGNMAMANINMSSGQLHVYDNFLGDVFSPQAREPSNSRVNKLLAEARTSSL